MKLMTSDQIRNWDLKTIENEGISSVALMERASQAFVSWFANFYADKQRPVSVIVGSKNNGGDGFAIARMLKELEYNVRVHFMRFGKDQTEDNRKNEQRLLAVCLYDEFQPITFRKNEVLIDALLGTGIRGALKGPFLELVRFINTLRNEVVAVDIPSGLNADGHLEGEYINAIKTLTFQLPKISFFTEQIPFETKAIGLNERFLKSSNSQYFLIDREMVRHLMTSRDAKMGKHEFGFGQLCGGSPGIMGAILLGAQAALRCGIGRLVMSVPGQYQSVCLSECPEAMVQIQESNVRHLRVFKKVGDQISGVAIGPGLGSSHESLAYVDQFLSEYDERAILDADALNIIARQGWQNRLRANSIITPHSREFDRLFGKHANRRQRIQKMLNVAQQLGIYIVLKGAYTAIGTPEGNCYFNKNGNVGMATAGSGDVLTGMLLSFLSQGYSSLECCILGVYLHGLAGDHAKMKYGEISLIASDIIEHLPEVIINVYEK